jgi:hypothetical protein
MHAFTLSRSGAGKALNESPIDALRGLHIEETDDEVVITGSVPTYYLKQLAQEAILPVLGRRELFNRVTVVRSN